MSELQGTKEWHEKRVGIITASRVGAILGLSPHAAADDVLREMVRERHGAEREFKGNIATQWGTDHEDTAIEKYEQETGRLVISHGFMSHPTIEWLGASPDGLAEEGLIEVKCPYSQKLESLTDRVDYVAQVQIQMEVADREWCDFVMWAPDNMTTERLGRDRDWFSRTKTKIEAFYNRYLSELDNPAHLEPLELDMTENTDWLVAEKAYLQCKLNAEQIKEELDRLKSVLVDLSGGKKAKGSNLQVFPVTRSGSIQYARAFKDLMPDADLSKYQGKPSTSYTVKDCSIKSSRT